jgi:predicted GIY-YIG superfamily endonuclease
MEVCYLLHFDRAYWHARHYLGTTRNLAARIEAHRGGKGARLVQVITSAGIGFRCVRTWKGGYQLERRLKRWHKSTQLCPVCRKLQRERKGY